MPEYRFLQIVFSYRKIQTDKFCILAYFMQCINKSRKLTNLYLRGIFTTSVKSQIPQSFPLNNKDCKQYHNSFVGHSVKAFGNKCSISCNSRHMWSMTYYVFYSHGSQMHLQHLKRNKMKMEGEGRSKAKKTERLG